MTTSICFGMEKVDSDHENDANSGSMDVNEQEDLQGRNKHKFLDGPMTVSNKRLQLIKMLCLTVLPILVLWAYSLFTLTETIHKKIENQRTKGEVQLSVELGKLIHHLQQERDMNVLYLSALGPETKTFLLAEYIETDRAIHALSKWPADLDDRNREQFQSQEHLQKYLSRHRQIISKNSYDLNEEIQFYTVIINTVIVWLYKSITAGKVAQVWKTLVAYLKLTSGKQDIGIERALGTLFFIDGSFRSQSTFEMYNNRINRFRAFHTTAELYSSRVDRLYTSGVNNVGGNVTEIINSYRHEIQHYTETKIVPDIKTARFWFDNMTLYLDTLLNVQRDLGYEIIEKLDVVIEQSTQDLTISAIFLFIVLLMCPLVIFATENLTSVVQKNAQYFVFQTAELANARAKLDEVLTKLMPAKIAHKVKRKETVEVEYVQSIAILMVGFHGFDEFFSECNVRETIEVIEALHKTVEYLVGKFEIDKIESVDGSFIIYSGIVSGFPTLNDTTCLMSVADFALELNEEVRNICLKKEDSPYVKLQSGIDTGHCLAAIIGDVLPRYIMIGDALRVAKELQTGCPKEKIRVSFDAYDALRCKGVYELEKIPGGETEKDMYFLQGRKILSYTGIFDTSDVSVVSTLSDKQETSPPKSPVPGPSRAKY